MNLPLILLAGALGLVIVIWWLWVNAKRHVPVDGPGRAEGHGRAVQGGGGMTRTEKCVLCALGIAGLGLLWLIVRGANADAVSYFGWVIGSV